MTIKNFGEPLIDNCSKSRLIYHFDASYFEPVESHLKMRKDWINCLQYSVPVRPDMSGSSLPRREIYDKLFISIKFSFLPLLISYTESYCMEYNEDRSSWTNPSESNCEHINKTRMNNEFKDCFESGTPRDMFGHLTSDDIGTDSRDRLSARTLHPIWCYKV